MQDFPQPIATERHSHADEHIGPDLAPSNGDDASKVAFAMVAAASASGLPSITPQAMLSDIPSCIVHEDLEEAADLDIDDLPVVANTASNPSLIGSAGLSGTCLRTKESSDIPLDRVVSDLVATTKLKERKPQVSSRHKRMARESSKHDALFNKKRTFSLKEHMKEADIHPSDEETAHSFKWLTMNRPQYFSIAQVESQPPLPVPEFTFVDLMNAAPHLAATVQRNVAISIASDLQMRKALKASDPQMNPNMASKASGGTAVPTKAKLHSSKNSGHPVLKNHGKHTDMLVFDASLIQKTLDQEGITTVSSNLSSSELSISKKQRNKASSKSALVHPPGASSMSASALAPSGKDRTVPRAPQSSVINTTLSKKLVRSATHVYIANYIKEMKSAQEALKKIEEKHHHLLLRQQQDQRAQQRLQQQQMQQQMQQQQAMHYLQRSQQGPAMQSQDTFMSKANAVLTQPHSAQQSSTKSVKSSAQRPKSSPQPALPRAGSSYLNPSLSYMMMPPAAAQRAYTSPAAAHVPMSYSPSAYNAHAHAQAQAQYHNQYIANMQQMNQMNPMNQQHQYVRPQSSSHHQPHTAGVMPYASMGFPASPYMFGPSQGLSSGISIASRPLANFNVSRQPSLQEQMKISQQSEHAKNLQSQMLSLMSQQAMRQQALVPPEASSRSNHRSPRIAPNPPSGTALSSTSASEHRVIQANVEDS